MSSSTTVRPDPAAAPPARPTLGRRIRTILKRTALTLLALLLAFIGLGIVLQATGAVPASGATPTATPAPVVPAAALPTVAPQAVPPAVAPAPVVASAPATGAPAPTSVAQPPVVQQPVVQQPATQKPVAQKPVATAAPKKVVPQPVVKAPAKAPVAAEPAPEPVATSYANCTAVKAAGAAPIYRGQPGYSSRLDRDGDGVACEK